MAHTIEGVEVHTNERGLVIWMSDWKRCYEFVQRGFFTKKFYRNSYGHTDFYINNN